MELIKIIGVLGIISIFFEGFGMGWWGLIPALLIIFFIAELLGRFEDRKRSIELDVNGIIRNVKISVYPTSGKVEEINIYLDNSRYLYDIPPERLKSSLSSLTFELEKVIQQNKKSSSYGYDYAVRNFYADKKLIFNWTKSS